MCASLLLARSVATDSPSQNKDSEDVGCPLRQFLINLVHRNI